MHSNYTISPTGIEPNQASTATQAAITIETGKKIRFENCEISQIAQHAIWFKKGSSNSSVNHCYIKNIGGGGVYIGDTQLMDDVPHTQGITLTNSIIQSGGKMFPSAVGVWIGHSSDNVVSHNDISDFYYTGVSVGWRWGYDKSVAKRNTVSYNHIHHIGWTLLSDMSGVYTLGKSEGTIVSNNVIHHIHAFSYGGWGLYTDEGSSGIMMENNLVYSTKTGGFHQHYGANNMIKNNIFAFAKKFQLQCTRVEDHLSFTFENNIVIFNQGVLLKGSWREINIKMDNNLYWHTSDNEFDFNTKNFKRWKKTGHDANSLVSNPQFYDAPNFDFRLKSLATVNEIGFVPFDYSKVGVYGKKSWINKALLDPSILALFDQEVERNQDRH